MNRLIFLERGMFNTSMNAHLRLLPKWAGDFCLFCKREHFPSRKRRLTRVYLGVRTSIMIHQATMITALLLFYFFKTAFQQKRDDFLGPPIF